MSASGTTQAAATMQVPMLDLQAQYRPIRDAVLDAVTRVCDSQRFIMGPEVEGMEREMAAYLGVAHAVGVSSGTDALLLAMMALGIGPGDEVITSTYSFFATAGCVARLGATPVLVDIDPITYNIDPAAAAAAVTPKNARDHPRPPVRAERRSRPAARGRGARRCAPHRGCGAGDRRDLQGPARRRLRAGGLLLVLPQQEPGGVRRRRARHHERRHAGRGAPPHARARRRPPVLPPGDRRELPPRRAAGRRAPRQAAAPGRLDRGAAPQRRALRSNCSPRPAWPRR